MYSLIQWCSVKIFREKVQCFTEAKGLLGLRCGSAASRHHIVHVGDVPQSNDGHVLRTICLGELILRLVVKVRSLTRNPDTIHCCTWTCNGGYRPCFDESLPAIRITTPNQKPVPYARSTLVTWSFVDIFNFLDLRIGGLVYKFDTSPLSPRIEVGTG